MKVYALIYNKVIPSCTLYEILPRVYELTAYVTDKLKDTNSGCDSSVIVYTRRAVTFKCSTSVFTQI